MSREKPLEKQMYEFCRYHLGKGCFAPFNGQDYPAWKAFVYLLQCYSAGGEAALVAMRATLDAAQPSEAVMRVFVQTIPGVLDWSSVAQIWPQISNRIVLKGSRLDVRFLKATERTDCYRRDSNQIETRITEHGASL